MCNIGRESKNTKIQIIGNRNCERAGFRERVLGLREQNDGIVCHSETDEIFDDH